MSDPTIRPDDLRGRRWRGDLHEAITPVPFTVDPLAEEAGNEIGQRYGQAVTSERLPLELVADVVNTLNRLDLAAPAHFLLGRPNVLVVALERVHSEGTIDTGDPARSVVDFVRDRAYPEFVDELVDRFEPRARELGLEPGDAPRAEVVRRLREDGMDIREGHLTESLAEVLRQVRDDRGGDRRPREAPVGAPRPAGRGRDAVSDQGAPAAGGRGRDHRPPDLWGVDCDLDVPTSDVAPPVRGDLLRVARTIASLYQLTERQPLFAAMDTLREQVLGSDLLNPLDVAAAKVDVEGQIGLDEQLCRLRQLSHSWNHEFDPLTLRRRADVAATIGIRDSAGMATVNTGFARAADQLVDVLSLLATDRENYPAEWVSTVAADVSLQLAGYFRTALTGKIFMDVALWRRNFASASEAFTSPVLRGLLGVGADPDPGPAPAIRKVLPSARFDAALLFREWAALDRVLELAQRLAIEDDVPFGELGTYVRDALTLRALRGRLRAPARQTTTSR